MENWGLVCFRDTALLLDQASSSASAFQEVAETVSHELAHQVGLGNKWMKKTNFWAL